MYHFLCFLPYSSLACSIFSPLLLLSLLTLPSSVSFPFPNSSILSFSSFFHPNFPIISLSFIPNFLPSLSPSSILSLLSSLSLFHLNCSIYSLSLSFLSPQLSHLLSLFLFTITLLSSPFSFKLFYPVSLLSPPNSSTLSLLSIFSQKSCFFLSLPPCKIIFIVTSPSIL